MENFKTDTHTHTIFYFFYLSCVCWHWLGVAAETAQIPESVCRDQPDTTPLETCRVEQVNNVPEEELFVLSPNGSS